MDEEEIKMDDGLHLLWRDFFNLLTCGRHSLVSGTQNQIVVS